MVLPSSPPDDVPREGAWLQSINRQLKLGSKGLLLLVDHARPERLRELVLALLPDYPELDVYTNVTDVVRVPEGSVMILAPLADDANWLNMNRPLFARRELKIILWCDEETTRALATKAPDFFDWISHIHDCPPGVPMHAVYGIRAALCARAPGIVWTGGDLEACFRVALPGRQLVHLSAKRPLPELVEVLRKGGKAWLVWEDVDWEFELRVMEQALIEAGRRSRVIAKDAGPHDWPKLHGNFSELWYSRQMLALAGAKAPGRLAVLVGLEPEALNLVLFYYDQEAPRSLPEDALEGALRNEVDPGALLARIVHLDRRIRPSVHGFEVLALRAFHETSRSEWNMQRHNLKRLALTAIESARAASIRGELDQAEILAERAVDITLRVNGATSFEHAEALLALARIKVRRGHFKDAELLLRQALAAIEAKGTDRYDRLLVLLPLVDVLVQQGRYEEAEEMADSAVAAASEYDIYSRTRAGRPELLARLELRAWDNQGRPLRIADQVQQRIEHIRALRRKSS